MSGSGARTAWYDGPATLELSDTSEFVIWDKRPYRGVLQYVPGDSLLFVVNRLDVEDYLRGVVPLEIGTKSTDEHEAVEAQAVTARGFTYTKMLYGSRREFDLTASSSDQVYRGVDVETFIGDLAVAATAGWVLSDGGRVIVRGRAGGAARGGA